MLRSMSARQLAEWQAFYRLEPWGYEAERALPAGLVAATVANCHRGKDSEPFTPLDFMPYSEAPKPRELSDEERAEQIRALLTAKAS